MDGPLGRSRLCVRPAHPRVPPGQSGLLRPRLLGCSLLVLLSAHVLFGCVVRVARSLPLLWLAPLAPPSPTIPHSSRSSPKPTTTYDTTHHEHNDTHTTRANKLARPSTTARTTGTRSWDTVECSQQRLERRRSICASAFGVSHSTLLTWSNSSGRFRIACATIAGR